MPRPLQVSLPTSTLSSTLPMTSSTRLSRASTGTRFPSATHYLRTNLCSCYNAFSRLDMRVQVQIPGTVESYCVNERGDKLEASEDHWLETYLCSVLRAYSYADDGSGDVIKKIVGVRRFNPITNTETEHKFLEAAERLFFNGMSRQDSTSLPACLRNCLIACLLAPSTLVLPPC